MTIADFFTLTNFLDPRSPLYLQVSAERTDCQPVTHLRFRQDQTGIVFQAGQQKPLRLEQVQTRLSQVGQQCPLYWQATAKTAPEPILGFHQDEQNRLVLR
ncbi:hypothetical protein PT274_02260 [Leuconostocaceae bacterium ESL0958]|nr:hypothetical protein [Leuconostocaceae bacterium ESL0958]